MSDFQRALEDYQNQQQSVAQATLAENESLKESKAGMIQAQGASLIGKTGTLFGDKVKEEAQKFQDEIGIDLSLGTVIPGALKLGSRLANLRQSALNSRWKDVNSERFNQRENQAQTESDETGINDIEPMQSQTLEGVRDTGFPTRQVDNPAFEPESAGDISSGEIKNPVFEPESLEEDVPKEPTFDAKLFKEPTEPDTSGLKSEETGLESEETGLETTAEDLAPEITSAAETAGSISSTLSDAIPVVGGILGLAGLISGSVGLADTIKEQSEDPYAGIRGKLGQYQQQIGSLEKEVSADQFQEKLGAARPSFGSLAVPVADTAKMPSIALHD